MTRRHRPRMTLEEFKVWFKAQATKIKGGCWIWPHSTNGRYGKVGLNYKEYSTHTLSYRLFVGDIPLGMKVCHTCDNPLCYNPKHLWLGTQADNMKDCVRKGRWVHPRASKRLQ